MWQVVFALIFYVTYAQGQTSDYCSKSLCSGGKHIACGNNGAFSSTCLSGRTLVDLSPYKNLIVDKHNTYRNQLASGSMKFKPASRMATMQWDDELAKLAVLNVKQCVMKHDSCRNTDRFKWSGQNLAWCWGRPSPSAESSIIRGIDNWFNEYKGATQANLDKYTSTKVVIGHFTAMVNDRNTRVGCGMLTQPKNDGAEFFFACNYAQTNILNKPIYVSGTAASKCTKGKNAKYSALCAASEPIDPNSIP